MLFMVESQNPTIQAASWRLHSGLWQKNPSYRLMMLTIAASVKTATITKLGEFYKQVSLKRQPLHGSGEFYKQVSHINT